MLFYFSVLSLSIVVGFIKIIMCNLAHMFSWPYIILLHEYTVILSTDDQHLSCFHFRAILNSAAIF